MSFQIALSGLDAASTDLEVTSNNIANSRTNGFKEARTEFGDVFATSINDASATASGRGVRVNRIAQQFSQGTVDFTSRNLDLAINGDGYFVLQGDDGGTEYTRAGAYSADKDGFIVNHKLQKLQVYPAEVDGSGETTFTTGVLRDLQLPLANSAPRETETIVTALNLDAADTGSGIAFDPDRAETYNYATSTTVYDSLGAPHTGTFYYDKRDTIQGTSVLDTGDSPITTPGGFTVVDENGTSQAASLTFTHAGGGTWNVALTVGGAGTSTQDLAGNTQSVAFGAATPVVSPITNILSFNYSGTTYTVELDLTQATGGGSSAHTFDVPNDEAGPDNTWDVFTYVDGVDRTAAANTMQFRPNGALLLPTTSELVSQTFTPSGADAMQLTINIADMTQFGGDYAVSNITQNGFATGRLSGLDIDAEGVAFARYTNGQAEALGKVALAKFNSPQNLSKVGDTNWAESFASGQPLLGEATTSSFGSIQSGALEASNVDLAEQLVGLITAQRAFQANSKVVTSVDQILQTIINI